ncbi:amidohydrolase family protein [soil metagenome]
MKHSFRIGLLILAAVTADHALSQQAKTRKAAAPLPVIDMHIHASSVSEFGGGGMSACIGDQRLILPAVDPRSPPETKNLMECASEIKGSASDEALLSETIAELRRHNVRRAIAMGGVEKVAEWTTAGEGLFIPGLNFSRRDRSADEFRRLYEEGKFKVFAEIGPQYRGFSPSDPVWEPYFALAEELDIPVGIHMGEGPPGGVHVIGPSTYRVSLGNPLLLEELLVRHPKMRVYVMHYGSPLIDEMIAMLFSHPHLYVDISCNVWLLPRKQFYEHLSRLIDAGYEKRIMFGSDQMAWPGTIGKAIESVEKAPFLNESQKRDILYNNAARFLRLTKEEIDRDHGR